MPYSHNPDIVIFNSIEETIRLYNYFTKRVVWKLRQWSSRLRKLLETGQRFLCFLAKSCCRRRLVAVDISNSFKKLAAACRRK